MDVLITGMLTFWFQAVLLSALPGGVLWRPAFTDSSFCVVPTTHLSRLLTHFPCPCSGWLRQEEGEELGGESDIFVSPQGPQDAAWRCAHVERRMWAHGCVETNT